MEKKIELDKMTDAELGILLGQQYEQQKQTEMNIQALTRILQERKAKNDNSPKAPE